MRKMLLFDRENRKAQIPWIIAVAAIVAVSLAWCIWSGFPNTPGRWRWPSGSSLPGFVLGVAGGLIIASEMLLWPRKALWRGRRLGRTKHWMVAHIWLGVLVLPLLLMHGGLHFDLRRSTLAAVLMWLLVLVFLSGVVGTVLQNVLPRLMMRSVPAETIVAQIGHVLAQYREEAAQLVKSISRANDADPIASPYLVLERVRQAGAIQGKSAETITRPGYVANSEPLRAFYEQHVSRFLEVDDATSLPLSREARAASLFRELKLHLPAEAHPIADRLAELCDQRRQFDIQRRLNRLLHGWLAVHLPLSAALFVLMLVHVFLALKFV